MASAEPLAPPSARELFTRMRGKRILVVGDLMIDEWIWGDVSRISPEAPVPVVKVGRHTFTLGGAGNVANNLRALGAEVAFVGVVGDDGEGTRAKEMLTGLGVDTSGVLDVLGRLTTRKTRIVAHNQQVVRADWESTEQVWERDNKRLVDEIKRLAVSADAIVLSDYGKGLFSQEIVAAAVSSRHPVIADPKPTNYSLFQHVEVLAPNAAEAIEVLSSRGTRQEIYEHSLERAADDLLRNTRCQYVLVTRGEQGMTLYSLGQSPLTVKAVARTVYDVSGAGDTVVAVLGLARAANISIQLAMQLANFAAGVVVEKLGTATASPDEVVALLEASER